jgi:predicted restriction endonuclease
VAWDDGYFLLEGFGAQGANLTADTRTDSLLAVAQTEAEAELVQVPADDYEARVRVLRQIVARRGQAEFRQSLIDAYQGRCAVTGCDVLEVLEAAHLKPYRGPDSNSTGNGILLRADLHTLVDLQLVAVHPEDRVLPVSKRLDGSEYEGLRGSRLRSPVDLSAMPAVGSLYWVYQQFLNAESIR